MPQLKEQRNIRVSIMCVCQDEIAEIMYIPVKNSGFYHSPKILPMLPCEGNQEDKPLGTTLSLI